jgi:hypothetical protein
MVTLLDRLAAAPILKFQRHFSVPQSSELTNFALLYLLPLMASAARPDISCL